MRLQKLIGATVTAALATTMVLGTTGAANATDTPPTKTAGETTATVGMDLDMDSLVSRADPYVSVAGGKFVLNDSAARAILSPAEIATVTALIDSSNNAFAPGSGTEVGAQGAGVTKLQTHWYGYRVYLARSVVNNIGLGANLGAAFVPVAVVRIALATLGILSSAAKHGVVFNWSPAIIPGYPFGVVWGSEWQ